MDYQWDFRVAIDNLPLLLSGLKITVVIALLSMVLGAVLGLFTAISRLCRWRALRWLAYGYTEFFRMTPLLVQIVWIYYVLPIALGTRLSPLAAAVIALTLNLGAFMAEIFRAGVEAVGKGQTEAGLAIGLTSSQTVRRIILPQAFKNVVPPAASMWLSLFKDTSLVSVIAVADLMYRAKAIAVGTYRPLEILTAAAAIYFIIVYPQSILIDRLYSKWRGEDKKETTLKEMAEVQDVDLPS